ncbi:MAG: polysaccharide deacetylase family protein [Alphaproteobacteria bacterium]|nr:polysaccharide deacetylase family protein [Alphaproteobacteria bacterium]MCB9692931.1 polysaccharide deacetylase family protein [Alphaproteobacteria bacterium]
MRPLGTTLVSGILLCALAAIGARTGVVTQGVALAVCAAVFLGILALIAVASASPGLALFGPTISRVPGAAAVALTFDDGPLPETTPRILEALGDRHRATFFLLADRAAAHPELTRAIAERHEIALHGASHHPWLTVMSPTRGAAELAEARARLEALAGRPVTRFRPPFGAVSPRVYASARRAGLELVWCSVRTRDGGPLPDGELARRVARAGPGDIVLLHDGREPTAALLPELLASLEARSLRSDTVEALCQA